MGDGLGSIRQAVDETGAVVAYNEYDPYGNPVQQASEPYGFTGEWWQAEVGLLHLRARWYLAEAGTFLSRDGFPGFAQRPMSQHPYAYATDNPLNRVDPSGYQSGPATGGGIIVTCWGIAFLIPEPFFIEEGVCALISLGFIVATPLVAEPVADAVGEMIDIANEAWDNWQPEPEDQPTPTPPPLPFLIPTPTPPNQCDVCDPAAFVKWWNSLPLAGGVQRGVDWYEYEQRVARGPGTMGGVVPRRVPAGAKTIDADGADPKTCRLLEAKFSPDPDRTQFREDGPPWVIREIPREIHRYRLAIITPNNIPGAQPSGLVIITNAAQARPFFENQLHSQGFNLNVDGFVRVTP